MALPRMIRVRQTFPRPRVADIPRAVAATNLPPGRFLLTVGARVVRLEWQPATAPKGRPPIVREVQIQ